MTATITAADLERFECDGYLMVPDAIDPARWIEPIMQEYETVLERLAVALLAAGRIGSLHDDLPFDQRLVEICAETNETNAQYFDFSLPQSNVRHETPMWHGPAVFEMLRCPGLLGPRGVLHRARDLLEPGPACAHEGARVARAA